MFGPGDQGKTSHVLVVRFPESWVPNCSIAKVEIYRYSVQPQLQKHGKWVSFLLLDGSKASCLLKHFLCSKQSWVSASACQRLASRSCLDVSNSRHHQAHRNEKKKNVSFQRPDWMPRAKLSWLCFSRPKASVSLARWNVWEGFTVYHRKTWRGKQGKKTDEIWSQHQVQRQSTKHDQQLWHKHPDAEVGCRSVHRTNGAKSSWDIGCE